jgi:cellulose synthase/poly-beta-1,6-N-acetylglucosamine synthase-like glycosyltransferase
MTVVVAACNEAQVLPASMEENLRLPEELRFVLVPAAKSKDATVDVARAIAERHPGRVRVVLGTSGSKAEDLNLAWASVDTELALILDADETLDERSLRRGLALLLEQPDVGIVQGRKVSRHPDAGFLARFISAERRYSTRLDHPMHADGFGSAHFAGSGALVRRAVAQDVGGWTPATMTEDIEFTLRVHTGTPWRIAYEPRMVVRESDPRDTLELLRQRTRWARGWTECFLLYFLPVLRRRTHLGRKRAAGLAWLLLTPVSALWTTLVPAMLVLRLVGLNVLPFWVALPLALLVLPSRLLAYGYAALRDPVIPLRRTPGRVAELVLHAYGWILLGWFIQLHALYLELSAAPRTWYVTRKRAAGSGSAQPSPARPEPAPLVARL